MARALNVCGFLSLSSCLILVFVPNVISEGTILSRNKRNLLFPNSTLFQFNAGVGSATPIKSVLVNWAFQANFQTPWNRSQIPYDILQANSGYGGPSRKKRESSPKAYEDKYHDDTLLYHVYKYAEELLNGLGYDGPACVHRTLCEFSAAPLHSDDDDDLFHEIAAFIFNPLNGPHPSDPKEEIELTSYLDTFKYGQEATSQDCYKRYNRCTTPLLDLFTKLEGNGIK